jgi:hypothetical protein
MPPRAPAGQYLLRIQAIAQTYGCYSAFTDELHAGSKISRFGGIAHSLPPGIHQAHSSKVLPRESGDNGELGWEINRRARRPSFRRVLAFPEIATARDAGERLDPAPPSGAPQLTRIAAVVEHSRVGK